MLRKAGLIVEVGVRAGGGEGSGGAPQRTLGEVMEGWRGGGEMRGSLCCEEFPPLGAGLSGRAQGRCNLPTTCFHTACACLRSIVMAKGAAGGAAPEPTADG